MSFLDELVRRNIFRVTLLYVASAWLVLELVAIGVDYFAVPGWIYRFCAAIGLICFPLAMVFSWIFEITPDGLKRETLVDRKRSITRKTGRNLLKLSGLCILGVVALNLLRFVLDGL